MRTSTVFSPAATRRGRVLVECCVSLVLLAGGSTLVLLLTSSTAFLVDEAKQQDAVLRETANQFALLDAVPCAVISGSSNTEVGPRIRLAVTTGRSGRLAHIRVTSIWFPSTYGGGVPRRHAIASAAWCE